MSEHHIVFVGGGPRTSMILERIAANRSQFPGGALKLHVVDPYPAGAGRIWREDQSPLLKLNSRAADVTMFTDESVQCLGPAVNGPALDAWVQLIRDGKLPDVPELLTTDRLLQEEVRTLGPEDFPTRRLQSCYLHWFFTLIRRWFHTPDEVLVHQDTVVDLIQGDSRHQVQLASGQVLLADQVVLVQGHVDARLDAEPRSLQLAAAAAAHPDLGYFAPGYTNDIDFSGIPAGAEVLVSGMGLAFTDLFVLLFEGRGGRFENLPDGTLRYLPSGREPRLLAGSRRGVPYHSKIRSTPRGEISAEARYLTVDAVARLHQEHGSLDFFTHLWPLIAKEAGFWYYRELLTGHPERTTGSFADFVHRYDALHWYSAARSELVAQFIPHLADRLEFDQLEFPLQLANPPGAPGSPAAPSANQIDRLVSEHIRQDLELRDGLEHSQLQALFLGLLRSYMDLRLVTHLLSDAGRLQLAGWWQGFFSFVDSGPPAHRLRELLALHQAGFIGFLGPQVGFGFDPDAQLFSAATISGPVHARWLIEARLPQSTVESTANPLIAALNRRGLAATEPGGSGKMNINTQRQVIGADSKARRWLFAVGATVAGFGGGAFSRPASNAAPFVDSDDLARELLTAPTMSEWELAGSVASAHHTIG
ncbi:FAD/NAD(P)-binding protein [Glutamicibacter sp. NPDC087344]|uniref:FAD/NAD(P)-binding protein n=1 Tax=Glutamicibacter sp. NPDC087344 TaxID=3363994 RepID=UPI00381F445A